MEYIPLASPDIREDDISEVVAVLRSGMLVQGNKVAELEKNIGSFIDAEFVAATSNGTSTMHLALVALGIGVGDEVIVPALSYVATANVVELVGATPIFVDVELDTFNIDVTKIEAAITPKTKVIIPVHEFGLACDMESILKIAKKHSLMVIEDAACALGAKQNGVNVGTTGDFGSFSLHPRKAITCGEGGLLAVKSSGNDKKVRVLRNHGVDIIDAKMEFIEAGFNYRLTDIQAALVNSQLNRLGETLKYKAELSAIYFNKIVNSKIKLPVIPKGHTHTWQTFHVMFSSGADRNKAIKSLKDQGVGTNYGAQCIPAQKYYIEKYNLNFEKYFPNALKAYQCGLAIPLYEKLTKEKITYIAEQLNRL
jgi:perosamine synthetase